MTKHDPHRLAEAIMREAGEGAAVDLANLLRGVPAERVEAVLRQLHTAVTLPSSVTQRMVTQSR